MQHIADSIYTSNSDIAGFVISVKAPDKAIDWTYSKGKACLDHHAI